MDFRLYDGALGRFFGIDLLADLFTSHSPYHFAYNNPVSFADPSGLQPSPGIVHVDYDKVNNRTMLVTFYFFDGSIMMTEGFLASVIRNSEPQNTKQLGINPHEYGGDGPGGTPGSSGGGSRGGGGGGGSGSGGSNGASNNSTAPDFTKEMELVGNAGTATSIIEQGAKRGERLYSQEAVKNSNAAKNAVKSANLAKWMSRAGNAVNVVTIGTEFINTLNNPNATGADYAKIGAKVGVAYLSNAINVAAPGLGIIVGIGLNYLIDEYGGAIYESVAEGFNNNRLAL